MRLVFKTNLAPEKESFYMPFVIFTIVLFISAILYFVPELNISGIILFLVNLFVFISEFVWMKTSGARDRLEIRLSNNKLFLSKTKMGREILKSPIIEFEYFWTYNWGEETLDTTNIENPEDYVENYDRYGLGEGSLPSEVWLYMKMYLESNTIIRLKEILLPWQDLPQNMNFRQKNNLLDYTESSSLNKLKDILVKNEIKELR